MDLRLAALLSVCLFPLPVISAEPPELRREFRGVWVATVANIDWPSKKGLPADVQKKELLAILDRSVAMNLNAIVLQVRPMCDALYRSKLEPWSEYLTGTAGEDPGYDPLEFAVKEAHARGLELHAWFNPYRAHHPSSTGSLPATHLVKKRPDLAKPYGKHHWLNPTHHEVADHTMAVVLDVVRRYDVDGVHMDDYFYPYAEKGADGNNIAFPDDDTWAAYEKAGGMLSRSDWRRDAVDRFVERMYREVKNEKKWVQVGISPFGIWRPGHPPGIEGFDQYEGLFADAKKWLNEGWVDYFTPQLYWPIKQEKQSYPKLLGWWAGENTKKRHLWPGNIPSRANDAKRGWTPQEVADQIRATRDQAGATGNIHFSMKALMKGDAPLDQAFADVYSEPALVPRTPWLDDRPPPSPAVEWLSESKELRINPTGEPVRLFVMRQLIGDKWQTVLKPADGDKPVRVKCPEAVQIRVSAVDRLGNESAVVHVAAGK